MEQENEDERTLGGKKAEPVKATQILGSVIVSEIQKIWELVQNHSERNLKSLN